MKVQIPLKVEDKDKPILDQLAQSGKSIKLANLTPNITINIRVVKFLRYYRLEIFLAKV